MHKDNRETIAELRTIGDGITLRLILKLITIQIENLRIDNDAAPKEYVEKNQGGIRELSILSSMLAGRG